MANTSPTSAKTATAINTPRKILNVISVDVTTAGLGGSGVMVGGMGVMVGVRVLVETGVAPGGGVSVGTARVGVAVSIGV